MLLGNWAICGQTILLTTDGVSSGYELLLNPKLKPKWNSGESPRPRARDTLRMAPEVNNNIPSHRPGDAIVPVLSQPPVWTVPGPSVIIRDTICAYRAWAVRGRPPGRQAGDRRT